MLIMLWISCKLGIFLYLYLTNGVFATIIWHVRALFVRHSIRYLVY